VAKLGFWHGQKKESGLTDGAGTVAPAVADVARQAEPSKPWAGRKNPFLLVQNYEDSGQGWFWATDVEGRVTYLTDSVLPALCPDPSRLSGLTLADLFRPAEEADGSLRTLPFLLMKRAKFDRLTLRANISGDERWWSLSGTPQFDAAGVFTGYIGNGVDMTEQRRSSEHASKLAKNDPLTGLPNRLRMAEVLAADLVSLDYQKRSCAVILIDLDRFKQVNDTLGHLAGDALLTQVAERLRRIVEDDERIFRLGGDEFQIIIRDCDDRGVLGDLANRVISMLSQPYSVNGSRCIIGASVGIAMSPFDGPART
jgi:diguanylate cyclase (GGDEF)-like protein